MCDVSGEFFFSISDCVGQRLASWVCLSLSSQLTPDRQTDNTQS